MNEVDIVISEALHEYETHGVVSTSTYCAMTSLGLDADEIIEEFE